MLLDRHVNGEGLLMAGSGISFATSELTAQAAQAAQQEEEKNLDLEDPMVEEKF